MGGPGLDPVKFREAMAPSPEGPLIEVLLLPGSRLALPRQTCKASSITCSYDCLSDICLGKFSVSRRGEFLVFFHIPRKSAMWTGSSSWSPHSLRGRTASAATELAAVVNCNDGVPNPVSTVTLACCNVEGVSFLLLNKAGFVVWKGGQSPNCVKFQFDGTFAGLVVVLTERLGYEHLGAAFTVSHQIMSPITIQRQTLNMSCSKIVSALQCLMALFGRLRRLVNEQNKTLKMKMADKTSNMACESGRDVFATSVERWNKC
eukprot:1861366-Amphidinium_carterae.2